MVLPAENIKITLWLSELSIKNSFPFLEISSKNHLADSIEIEKAIESYLLATLPSCLYGLCSIIKLKRNRHDAL